MSDLPEVVTPGNSVSLYADDCKTSRVINCPAHHSLFQTDTDNIHSLSLQNVMAFNVKKCKLMRIWEKRSSFLSDLHLNNSTLELTSEFCDLGLVTNCNLSWNNHIHKITSKANKILGLIIRTCKGPIRCFYSENPLPCFSSVSTGVLLCRVVPISRKKYNEVGTIRASSN